MSTLRTRFLELMARDWPSLPVSKTEGLVSENLLSDFVLPLPANVLRQAQDFVAAAFTLRQSKAYRNQLITDLHARGLEEAGNYSIAMSYDFHLDPKGDLKLIEVNTNASFLALSQVLYETQSLSNPVSGFDFSELRRCFEEELQLTGRPSSPARVLIIDQDPPSQRLFIEFLLYQEIFRSWGWTVKIQDSKESFEGATLIYNRDTDFYLQTPALAGLREGWLENRFCLSPNPAEYYWLADKQRLLDWSGPGFLESTGISAEQIQTLRQHLPQARELTSDNAEDLWSQRKTLFLKPKRSFGAKQSYRGASISRKIFDALVDQDLLAQEFVPAPEVEVPTPDGVQKMKYDLRFYAYKGRVQSAVARLYQGQVTNLRTPHGGFACVQFRS